MNEEQIKAALNEMLKVRLTLRDIMYLHTAVDKNISELEKISRNNSKGGTTSDLAFQYKGLKKKLEIIWDEMEKREMTPNEYLERMIEL